MRKMNFLLFVLIISFLQTSVSAVEIYLDLSPGRLTKIDGEGYIYVDYGRHSISCYTPKGELFRRIGRKGAGPGDIKRLGWFDINPVDGLLYVTEFLNGNKWISKFARDGKFHGHWQCELDWSKYSGISMIQFDSKGNAFIETNNLNYQRFKNFNLGTSISTIIKLSPEGKIVKSLYQFKSPFSGECGGKGNITIPFQNYLFWSLYKDELYVRENNEDFISVYNGEGVLKQKIFLPFKRERLTDSDLDDWIKWLKRQPSIKQGIAQGWFDLKFWRKNLPFTQYKPVSGRKLFFDSNGNLYSKKYSGYTSKNNSWAKICIADNSVSIVRFPIGEKLISVWNGYFFFSVYDRESNYIVYKKAANEVFKTGGNNNEK